MGQVASMRPSPRSVASSAISGPRPWAVTAMVPLSTSSSPPTTRTPLAARPSTTTGLCTIEPRLSMGQRSSAAPPPISTPPRAPPAPPPGALPGRGPAGRRPVSGQEQVAHRRPLGGPQPGDAGPRRERGVPLLDHERPLYLGGARRREQRLHLASEQRDDLPRRQVDELVGATQRDIQVLTVAFLAPQLRLVEQPLERRVQERRELQLRHLTVVPQVHVDDGRGGDTFDSSEERLLAQRPREKRLERARGRRQHQGVRRLRGAARDGPPVLDAHP